MDLKIKDIVEMLEVTEKTVYRWIKDRKIPCYRINHQYRFNRAEINEWILNNRILVANPNIALASGGLATDLVALIRNGGIYYDIAGDTVRQVLHNAVYAIETPKNISKEDVFFAILNREEMMSTAAGRGVALPHPRNPIIAGIDDASVSIAFLKKPVDFKALDGIPVHTLFLILTNAPKRHLEVLSKISHLCQMDDFLGMLQRRAEKEEILNYIQTRELQWAPKETVA
jgi:PTS system nitrogen regulatory IIA component